MTADAYIATHPTLQGLEAYCVATPYNRINFNLSYMLYIGFCCLL